MRISNRLSTLSLCAALMVGCSSPPPPKPSASAPSVAEAAEVHDQVNISALAALRPGMAALKVREAMGTAWRAPAPHQGGLVDVLENSHGVQIRIDKNDVIGMVVYDHRFTHDVEGLRMGLSLKAAEAALPDLKVGPDLNMMPGVRLGTKVFSDGVRLNVKFTLECINEITLVNVAAVYPEKTAPAYPAASGTPGAPFADVNFKLVVLSSLLDAKIIDLGSPQQLATHLLARPVDLQDEGYELIPAALDYLARYPLTDDLLAKVTSLKFDGGSTVYPYAWYLWDGEDDTFNVRDLSGIELCSNVTSLEVASMVDAVDIRRLISLRKLERLDLDSVENLEALLDLPALKQIRIMNDRIYGEVTTPNHPTRRLFETLKERGVHVWVHWTTHPGPDRPPPFD